jgi:aminoglycoside phosphotransferase (APT) family kinase protein
VQTALPGIDAEAIHRYLDRTVAADAPPPQIRLLAGGRSNVSYQIAYAGRRFVLRRPPLGNIMPSAHDMGREFTVLSGLSRVEFPVPRPEVLCEDTSIIGAPFLLMDFVDGDVVADSQDAAALTPQLRDAVSRSLVETLAILHRTDVVQARLEQLGRPAGYLERQVARWGQQWDRTRTRDLPTMSDLHAWLVERIPRIEGDRPWSLVHGDYRLDNVILDPHSGGVRAVLDWEMATLGDPVSDLAITLVYWNEAGDGRRRDIPVALDVTAAPGFWSRARLVEEYVARNPVDLSHLQECVALACYKLAVIMESIHKRAADGQQLGSASVDDGSMKRATEALALLGLAVIDGDPVRALGE